MPNRRHLLRRPVAILAGIGLGLFFASRRHQRDSTVLRGPEPSIAKSVAGTHDDARSLPLLEVRSGRSSLKYLDEPEAETEEQLAAYHHMMGAAASGFMPVFVPVKDEQPGMGLYVFNVPCDFNSKSNLGDSYREIIRNTIRAREAAEADGEVLR